MGDFNTTPVVLNNERRVIRPLENANNPWFIDHRNGVTRPITRALTRALASKQALPDDMVDMDTLANLVWKRKKKSVMKSRKVKQFVRATKSKRNTSYLLKDKSRKRQNRSRRLRNSQMASRAHAHRTPKPPTYYRGRTAYGPHEPATPNMSQSNKPGSQNASLAAIAEETLKI